MANPEIDLRGVGIALIIVPAIMCLCVVAMKVRRFLRERVHQEMRVDVSSTLPIGKFWREDALATDASPAPTSIPTPSSQTAVAGDIEGTRSAKPKQLGRAVCIVSDAHGYDRMLQSYAEDSAAAAREQRLASRSQRASGGATPSVSSSSVGQGGRRSGNNGGSSSSSSGSNGNGSGSGSGAGRGRTGSRAVAGTPSANAVAAGAAEESAAPSEPDSFVVDVRIGWEDGRAVLPGEVPEGKDAPASASASASASQDSRITVLSTSPNASINSSGVYTYVGGDDAVGATLVNVGPDVTLDVTTGPDGQDAGPAPRGLRIPVHNDACTICLDDFALGTDIKLLPCRHAFHAECIDPWLAQKSDLCPVCKASILEGLENARWEQAGCCIRLKRCLTCESCTRRVVRQEA